MAYPLIRIYLAILMLGAVASSVARAEDGVKPDELVLGSTWNLTGPKNDRARGMTAGMKLYLERINRAGGMNGRRLKLIQYDDAYDPKRSRENVQKLLEQDRVFAILGVYGTSNANSAAAALPPFGAPMMGASGSIAEVPAAARQLVYAVRPSYTSETQALARFGMRDKGWKRFAVVSQDDGMGRIARAGTIGTLHDAGIEPVANISLDRLNPRLTPDAIKKIQAARPDAVVLLTVLGPGQQFVEEAQKLDFHPPILSTSSLVTPEFLAAARANHEPAFFAQGYPTVADTRIPLVGEYLEESGRAKLKPEQAALNAFIDAAVFVEAMRRAGKNITRASLLETLAKGMRSVEIGGLRLGFSSERHVGIEQMRILAPLDNDTMSLVTDHP